jgi:hypothetical protein
LAGPEYAARSKFRKPCRERGWLRWAQVGSAYSGPGRSDDLVCAEGQFICVEWKSKTGKPSPAQIRKLQEVRAAGGFGFVTRSAEHAAHTIESYLKERRMEHFDLDAFLNEIEEKNKEGSAVSSAIATDPDPLPSLETTAEDMIAATAPDVEAPKTPAAPKVGRPRKTPATPADAAVLLSDESPAEEMVYRALMGLTAEMTKLVQRLDRYIELREKAGS